MKRRHFMAMGLAAVALASNGQAARAAKSPTTWDNLVQVPSKRFKLVYLAPGADFRAYNKVMLDPTEVAFHKDYLRDQNSTRRGLSNRISDSDVQKAVEQGKTAANDIFAKAFTDGGYAVVQAPGPDVLRVRTGLLNISVTAPDVMTAGRSRTYANEAGEATLVVEVRDSITGELLGRAVDRRWAGDNTVGARVSVTNRADFRNLAKSWAKACVEGVNELKRNSPVSGSTTK